MSSFCSFIPSQVHPHFFENRKNTNNRISNFVNSNSSSYFFKAGFVKQEKQRKSRIFCNMVVQVPSTTRIPPPSHPTYDLNEIINLALSEDAGDRGDITCQATVPALASAEAKFLAKEDGILAGIAMAEMVFHAVDPHLKIEWSLYDGDNVFKGDEFGTIKGNARSILIGERVALNFMQRMSGIATITNKMVEAAKPALILETRKTVPCLRLTDKWAVLIGGGNNHRMGLFDMMLIKDNHIATAGGIRCALSAVQEYLSKNNLSVPVEIETRTLEEVKEVMACVEGEGMTFITRIMLDNMVSLLPKGELDVSMLKEAVSIVNAKIETEASGNVTLETVNRIGATGVKFISSGAMTHSVKALDISLNIDTELAMEVSNRSLQN